MNNNGYKVKLTLAFSLVPPHQEVDGYVQQRNFWLCLIRRFSTQYFCLNLHCEPHNPQIIENLQLAPSSLDENQICRPGNDTHYCLSYKPTDFTLFHLQNDDDILHIL